MKDEFLTKITTWAQNEDSVRMLIQTGSHVRNDHSSDEFSDFDIEIFVANIEKYKSSDDWIRTIDSVWIILPLQNDVGDPTRLVIFDQGIKVDFTLNRIQDFEKLVQTQKDSELLQRGYKVLLDKDSLGGKLQPPSYVGFSGHKPSQQEFTSLVEEFFFEIYHVAKYLKRNDLWSVKFRDWTTKELLLKMIEWYEKSRHGLDYDTWFMGRNIHTWVEPDIYKNINSIFGHFDKEDSLRAMNETISLFRNISKQTAINFGLLYPEDVDLHITSYIKE